MDDASSTVTFWPAAVEIVKPDADTLSTVPDDPPAAGPDRALDPLPPGPEPPVEPLAAGVDEELTAAVVGGDVAVGEDEPQAESPITAHIAAAAMIRRALPLDSSRRPLGPDITPEAG